MKYLIANWKANGTWSQLQTFIREWQSLDLTQIDQHQKTVIIAPSHLFYLSLRHASLPVAMALQDISLFTGGAHTGEVGIDNLLDIAPIYCLVGHSERRREQKENNQIVRKKIKNLLKIKITPIICFDLLEMSELARLTADLDQSKLIFAYEPVSAISTSGGQGNLDPEKLQALMPKIKSFFPQSPIIYGGSVKAENAHLYSDICAGLLVGSASLQASSFYQIVLNF